MLSAQDIPSITHILVSRQSILVSTAIWTWELPLSTKRILGEESAVCGYEKDFPEKLQNLIPGILTNIRSIRVSLYLQLYFLKSNVTWYMPQIKILQIKEIKIYGA